MTDILKKICAQKQNDVDKKKIVVPQDQLERQLNKNGPVRLFTEALEKSLNTIEIGIIAEIKKASPSSGLIRNEFDPQSIATSYKSAGASCISVLTDTPFFQGRPEDLEAVRKAVDLPVIRKDFIIDPYQVFESRAMGADCILLIMAALTDSKAKTLYKLALDLDMDALVEIHNIEELDRAIALNSNLLGINNRNLKTLQVDLSVTEELVKKAPKDSILVSESGIRHRSDIERIIACGVNCFLVGESLMREKNIGSALSKLIGKNINKES